MKIIKGATIAILASITCTVQGKNLSATPSTNWNKNEELVAKKDRQLQYHVNGVCSWNGETRSPGQWLEGPKKNCMCDRYGSQKWAKYVNNDATLASTGADDLTARGARQKFDAKDFVYDLMGSVPVASSNGGTVQTLTVANLPSLAGQGVALTLFNIESCGINLPHSHPRAVNAVSILSLFESFSQMPKYISHFLFLDGTSLHD